MPGYEAVKVSARTDRRRILASLTNVISAMIPAPGSTDVLPLVKIFA